MWKYEVCFIYCFFWNSSSTHMEKSKQLIPKNRRVVREHIFCAEIYKWAGLIFSLSQFSRCSSYNTDEKYQPSIQFGFTRLFDLFVRLFFSRAHLLVEKAGEMSCARPSNFTLRRQKSLGCDCQPIVSTRERRLRLQKQYSVDQNRDNTASAVHRSTNNIQNVLKNGTGGNTLWKCNSPTPEASLRIFTAIKTKSQNHACETNEECVSKQQHHLVSFVLLIYVLFSFNFLQELKSSFSVYPLI